MMRLNLYLDLPAASCVHAGIVQIESENTKRKQEKCIAIANDTWRAVRTKLKYADERIKEIKKYITPRKFELPIHYPQGRPRN